MVARLDLSWSSAPTYWISTVASWRDSDFTSIFLIDGNLANWSRSLIQSSRLSTGSVAVRVCAGPGGVPLSGGAPGPEGAPGPGGAAVAVSALGALGPIPAPVSIVCVSVGR